jgi:hypothetical protein
VATTTGAPLLTDARGVRSSSLRAGGVVTTDAHTSARLVIGRIGVADIAPGSRLRLLSADASEHRLALDVGTIHARVTAPPRFFIVEAAGAIAADLGCEYTLHVDSAGRGRLVVESGEVELEHGGMRSAVSAGNAAAIEHDGMPGLPVPIDASDVLMSAVSRFDTAASAENAQSVIDAADGRATITLWHLLQRGTQEIRALTFDRLASLVAPPPTVTRALVIAGDSYALQRWRTELQRTWTAPSSWTRRIAHAFGGSGGAKP